MDKDSNIPRISGLLPGENRARKALNEAFLCGMNFF